MFSIATIKAFQIYGISIAISMFVAVLIKVLVAVTSRVKPTAKAADVPQGVAKPSSVEGISGEVIAAISSAITVVTGPHRILHIAESKRSWSSEGRIAQHSHQPRY
jgi:hypothetical protein